MPSLLKQGTGAPGLGGLPGDLPVNAPQPKTFVPPTGVNTGQPGRPQSASPAGPGGAPGTIPAPAGIAAVTNPQGLVEGQQAGPVPGAPTGVLPIHGAPGQLTYNPLTGEWTLPDGTTRPGVGGGGGAA